MEDKLKFIRVKRSCPHNDRIATGMRGGIPIYDFDVLEDGVKIAEMRRNHGAVGYVLCDLSGRNVTNPGTESRTEWWQRIVVERKADFADAIRKHRSILPSLKSIEARKVDEANKRKAIEDAERERMRTLQMGKRAKEMFTSLRAIASLYPEQCAQRADEVSGINDGKSRGILLQAALDISRKEVAEVEAILATVSDVIDEQAKISAQMARLS